MSSNGELPDDTCVLEHQIAGHLHGHGKVSSGMLKHTTEGYVMKPVQNDERGKKEIEFYEDVFLSANACSVITHLRDLVPRYLGLHQFISDDSVSYFIKMEDVASGCRKPCIADIKIGRQTWDPDSSPEKRLAENNKYRGTKEPLGFCIPGLFVNDISTNRVLKLDKVYGRTLDSVTVRDAIRFYLNGTLTLDRRLLSDFLRELHTIRLWFEDQRVYRFFATSLLLVYDADFLMHSSPTDSKTIAPIVRVRMIDFAHVYPAEGARDANYIHGLCNLIDIFEDFYREATTKGQ